MIFCLRGEFMSNIGQLIKNKREKAGLSLKKLGLSCGVSDTEIMKIENGNRKNPKWTILCQIARSLELHPFDFLLEAGYITEDDIHPNQRITGLDKLTEDEISTVQLFIDFIATGKASSINSREE